MNSKYSHLMFSHTSVVTKYSFTDVILIISIYDVCHMMTFHLYVGHIFVIKTT